MEGLFPAPGEREPVRVLLRQLFKIDSILKTVKPPSSLGRGRGKEGDTIKGKQRDQGDRKEGKKWEIMFL